MINTDLIPTASVERCPVCNSTSREIVASVVIPEDSYSRRLSDHLKVTPRELTNDSKEFECIECGAVFLDPWLNKNAQKVLFQLASPVHFAGWDGWEVATRTGIGQAHMIRLASMLEETLGQPEHYVEIACPFSGLLLATARSTELRKWRAKRSPSSFADPRMTEMARLYTVFERLGSQFVDMIHATWRFYSRVTLGRNGTLVRGVGEVERHFSGRRTFALVPSLQRWGLSCIRYGFGCSQVAGQALDCELAILDELAPDTADICGIFNSLDHVEAPLKVLLKCLEIAPHVVVSGHKQRTGYQHGFGLDIKTLQHLGAKHSFTVTDLSKQIVDWPSEEYLVLLGRV